MVEKVLKPRKIEYKYHRWVNFTKESLSFTSNIISEVCTALKVQYISQNLNEDQFS